MDANTQALAILAEFVNDVETVYGKDAEELRDMETGWYDLRVTYLKARKLVRDE
jgi:hypothetical protein